MNLAGWDTIPRRRFGYSNANVTKHNNPGPVKVNPEHPTTLVKNGKNVHPHLRKNTQTTESLLTTRKGLTRYQVCQPVSLPLTPMRPPNRCNG